MSSGGGGGFGGQGGGQGGGFGGGSQGGGFGGGGQGGGFGGGGGGFGGGGQGGGFGGGGQGGGFGGGGGGFGGGGGGFGGGGGGFGGGGQGGGFGGGGQGGGFGGGGQGGGFGGGGQGGGGGGGGDVTATSNISDLFSTYPDEMVGETPATNFIVGLDGGGTGTGGQAGGGGAGSVSAQRNAGTDDDQGAGLGGTGASSIGGDAPILTLLQRLIPDVYAPSSEERLSDMIYNPANNMLIVRNTPSNLEAFEEQLAQLDVTPKQVSIEAKFLTIRVSDLDKVGFKWDVSTESNSGARLPTGLEEETYEYDINGDNVLEEIGLDERPDGSNAFSNTLRETVVGAAVSPGPASTTFNLVSSILDNGSGDELSVTFDYLNSLEESELLSAPRVTTMNRKPAAIVDYTTEYFLVSVDTSILPGSSGINGTTQPIVATTPFALPFNFGIALSVTPQIRDNDQVRLWLNPEVRTRIGEKTFTSTTVSGDIEIDNVLTYPTTSWQAVWTNVIVHDGDTLVLGGLVQDKSIKGEQKLPYVADLPILGYFFRGKSKEVTQSSLLIFVTPDIIDSTGARFFDVASAE
jgi:type II secretory pathway component GspD/PulD (secretin)